jgi:hypothetical protein
LREVDSKEVDEQSNFIVEEVKDRNGEPERGE